MAPTNQSPVFFDVSRVRLRRRLKTLLWLIPVLVGSLAGAFFLRFDGQIAPEQQKLLLSALPWVLAVKLGVFMFGRLGRMWHAFVSLHDAIRLTRVTILASLAVAAANYLLNPAQLLPRGVILIDGCLTTLLICGCLTLRRILRERRERRGSRNLGEQEPVIIAGNAVASEVFLRTLKNSTFSKFRPVGLVTDRQRMLHREIAGVPILGLIDDTAAAAEKANASTVLLISGAVPGSKVRNVVEQCKKANINVQVIPDVNRIVDGHVDFQPREVAIEDLLGRETVSLDKERLETWVEGRTVLVTGSCGSIGSELSRQLLSLHPAKLLLLDRSETGQFFLGRELDEAIQANQVEILVADATDPERMEGIFASYEPEIIFHAAAYKHVPLMEQHPGEALKNIVGATRNLADLAQKYDCEAFVMVSTDKAVNPTSVMGCCKRVAELYVQSLNGASPGSVDSQCRFVTVRFGNVLGSAGSVIPVFRQQIAQGGPLTITHPDMTRFFMTIPEASQLVVQAGCVGDGGEIFVLDMGNPVRIMDLAADMVRLSGLELGRDIELQISGLRPGEKLYEELYAEGETQHPTQYAKILVAEGITMSRLQIMRHVKTLLASAELDGIAIRRALKATIPSYRPELLDESDSTAASQEELAFACDAASPHSTKESKKRRPFAA
ncbi:UDP-N-acetyl-alpha-D-glucosamine C6 dehydratase [Roseimaritima multifibrata]|uniref:UDP-N-acetyl-alpha-D-glucosamine C6 dehydratase n=1 Tax=Roseimaritima multifibrata TaxID=1930274 RepID=A0A517ME13_9BACT|nr:nucleoside-diphosphate sugar epimerase/dehydratase [Roseimaritima multifibrata]QDS93124.1 UDP-N-acetyl-alpha-D-glucosamine C6 dehydratase [Roseimaritima multifibrata]